MRDHEVPGQVRRPSGRTLVAGAVLALALGGWWWVSHPPAPEGTPADLAALPAPDAGEVWTELSIPRLIAIARTPAPDPEDGGSGRAGPPALPLPPERVAGILPPSGDAVLRTGIRLAPQTPYLHEGPAPSGGDYLLEVACVGDGELFATVTLPDYGYSGVHLDCDGRVADLELTYRAGYTAIELVAETWAEAAFQISRR